MAGATTAIQGENVFVGGIFQLAGGKFSENIASYNTRTKVWNSLSSATSSLVQAIYYHPFSNSVLVGGDFNSLNGTNCRRFCAYNVSTNSWFSYPFSNFNAFALAIVGVPTNSTIFVGGFFTSVNGTSVSKIARWNGTRFVAMANGLSASVFTLAWSSNAKLYAGGSFAPGGKKKKIKKNQKNP